AMGSNGSRQFFSSTGSVSLHGLLGDRNTQICAAKANNCLSTSGLSASRSATLPETGLGLDRPIGTWLLYLPCAWRHHLGKLQLACCQDPLVLGPIRTCAAALLHARRGYERTEDRPIPSGQVTVPRATAFLIGQSLLPLAFCFNSTGSPLVWASLRSLRQGDDLMVGVKSTALLFGDATKILADRLHSGMSLLLATAGANAQLRPVLSRRRVVASVQLDNPADCLAKFKSNRNLGLAFWLAIVLDNFLACPCPALGAALRSLWHKDATALHLASYIGHKDIWGMRDTVRKLLNSGATLDGLDDASLKKYAKRASCRLKKPLRQLDSRLHRRWRKKRRRQYSSSSSAFIIKVLAAGYSMGDSSTQRRWRELTSKFADAEVGSGGGADDSRSAAFTAVARCVRRLLATVAPRSDWKLELQRLPPRCGSAGPDLATAGDLAELLEMLAFDCGFPVSGSLADCLAGLRLLADWRRCLSSNREKVQARLGRALDAYDASLCLCNALLSMEQAECTGRLAPAAEEFINQTLSALEGTEEPRHLVQLLALPSLKMLSVFVNEELPSALAKATSGGGARARADSPVETAMQQRALLETFATLSLLNAIKRRPGNGVGCLDNGLAEQLLNYLCDQLPAPAPAATAKAAMLRFPSNGLPDQPDRADFAGCSSLFSGFIRLDDFRLTDAIYQTLISVNLVQENGFRDKRYSGSEAELISGPVQLLGPARTRPGQLRGCPALLLVRLQPPLFRPAGHRLPASATMPLPACTGPCASAAVPLPVRTPTSTPTARSAPDSRTIGESDAVAAAASEEVDLSVRLQQLLQCLGALLASPGLDRRHSRRLFASPEIQLMLRRVARSLRAAVGSAYQICAVVALMAACLSGATAATRCTWASVNEQYRHTSTLRCLMAAAPGQTVALPCDDVDQDAQGQLVARPVRHHMDAHLRERPNWPRRRQISLSAWPSRQFSFWCHLGVVAGFCVLNKLPRCRRGTAPRTPPLGHIEDALNFESLISACSLSGRLASAPTVYCCFRSSSRSWCFNAYEGLRLLFWLCRTCKSVKYFFRTNQKVHLSLNGSIELGPLSCSCCDRLHSPELVAREAAKTDASRYANQMTRCCCWCEIAVQNGQADCLHTACTLVRRLGWARGRLLCVRALLVNVRQQAGIGRCSCTSSTCRTCWLMNGIGLAPGEVRLA
uniref:ANK_REP_REGION domain-containing protein n=1 Tax=Macrostomum lignano TaxID=282301 RepID=A0A1I8FCC4_9PLAT